MRATWSSADTSITWCAPESASRASLSAERVVPITVAAPIARAIAIAASPTPLEAASTSTASPGARSALLTSASCAVIATFGNAAASIQPTAAGTRISASGCAITCSAWPPAP